MSYCKVKGCRYPNSHVTMGHKCGRCEMFGHGRYECARPSEKHKLGYFNDNLPEDMWCRHLGCGFAKLHTTDSHECMRCKKMSKDCYCDQQTINCPICRKRNTLRSIDNHKFFGVEQKCCICMVNEINILFPECKHACICSVCITKLTKSELSGDEKDHVLTFAKERLEGRDRTWCVEHVGQGCAWYIKVVSGEYSMFFLHGDNHGQYGPDTNDIPRLQEFLTGCTELE